MKILIVNPNTTLSMTEKIGEAARSVAAAGTEIIAVSPEDGPASIEGYYDEAFAVPGLLREVRKGETQGMDGYIVACFDDPGLHAVRSIATGPVVGICEAAVYAASMVAGSFTVVTTLKSSVPAIEKVVRGYGREHFCRRVRAADIPVLSLEEEGSEARLLIEGEIQRAVDDVFFIPANPDNGGLAPQVAGPCQIANVRVINRAMLTFKPERVDGRWPQHVDYLW